jgi:hypothetical protein
MSHYYQVYGLMLRTNRPLAGLPAASADRPVDVYVDLVGGQSTTVPDVASLNWVPLPGSEGSFALGPRVWSGASAEGRFVRVAFGGGPAGEVEFVIDPAGRKVWGHWVTPASPQDLTALFLGAVLAWVLRLRGTVCLHACALAVGSRAVLILGDVGAGKSTTAAALAQRGHPVLSDDIAAVTEEDAGWVVQPGYPRLRLWPSAARALNDSTAGLARVFSSVSDKCYLELSAEGDGRPWRFHLEPLPLRGIYLLTRDSGIDAPIVEPIDAAARLLTLLRHVRVGFAPLDQAQQAREFAQMSRLARMIPVRALRCPQGFGRLPALCEAVIEDLDNHARSC